jgi:hypothetical protein
MILTPVFTGPCGQENNREAIVEAVNCMGQTELRVHRLNILQNKRNLFSHAYIDGRRAAQHHMVGPGVVHIWYLLY